MKFDGGKCGSYIIFKLGEYNIYIDIWVCLSCVLKILQFLHSVCGLCPIACLSEYVKRTSKLRTGSDQLLMSIQKPHKPVSTHTISRWLKTDLEKAGIDTSVFKAHSTREASTSAAAISKIPLSTIMDNAGWSKTTTFGKFYKKPIAPATKAYGQLP